MGMSGRKREQDKEKKSKGMQGLMSKCYMPTLAKTSKLPVNMWKVGDYPAMILEDSEITISVN